MGIFSSPKTVILLFVAFVVGSILLGFIRGAIEQRKKNKTERAEERLRLEEQKAEEKEAAKEKKKEKQKQAGKAALAKKMPGAKRLDGEKKDEEV